MIYRDCANCGKTFGIKKPSEANRPNRKCCSRSCSTTLRNLQKYKDIGLWKTCKYCGKKYFARIARERKIKQYCNLKCALNHRNKEILPEHNKKIINEDRYNWKGEKAGYFAKHMWHRSTYGKANTCELCKGEKSTYFEWANISGKYYRKRNDWIQLCRSCHKRYDGGQIKKETITNIQSLGGK